MRNKRLIILFCILSTVTLFVVLSSVIFSVSTVTAHGLNIDVNSESGKQISKSILDNQSINGRNIFFLNDGRIKAQIHDNVPYVQVINIERKFPDRVSINFVALHNYFLVNRFDRYYLLRFDGKITGVFDQRPQGNFIELVGGNFRQGSDFKVNEFLFDQIQSQFLALVSTALGTIGLEGAASAAFFEFINLDTSIVYLGLRAGGLVRIPNASDFGISLRAAVSLVLQQTLSTGQIITAMDNSVWHGFDENYQQIRLGKGTADS
ncbi:MAG: FtsQ-type POTRA domain-containing protein [Firmicutes bacterium]|nr:FtsQ-type POTRA domain-containing protein [Bacillota bacterium]